MTSSADAAVRAATAALADKLHAARRARGITQEAAADAAGISTRNYQRLESNRPGSTTARRGTDTSNPQLDTVFRLALVLDVPVAWLIDPDQPPAPVPAASVK